MRVIGEGRGERIRLNHLLSIDLRGHTQPAAEPKGLDSGVCVRVCVCSWAFITSSGFYSKIWLQ